MPQLPLILFCFVNVTLEAECLGQSLFQVGSDQCGVGCDPCRPKHRTALTAASDSANPGQLPRPTGQTEFSAH